MDVVLGLDVEVELRADQVSIGDLGTGNDVVTNHGRPGLGNLLKNRLDGCEVKTRTTFNIGVESILDVVKGLKVVV